MGHILDNNIVDSFQSAYRAGHSCETALLRVYNDIVTTVGKGNGSFLVLLDLFAAFDTIDHDNLIKTWLSSINFKIELYMIISNTLEKNVSTDLGL